MAQAKKRTYLYRERSHSHAYSPGVVTEGGRIVWLAGHTGGEDETGDSLDGDFDAQVREIFRKIGETLRGAGGSLADLVSMQVFIKEPDYALRFAELRREIFQKDFPASAMIVAKGFVYPHLLVEVHGVAVIG